MSGIEKWVFGARGNSSKETLDSRPDSKEDLDRVQKEIRAAIQEMRDFNSRSGADADTESQLKSVLQYLENERNSAKTVAEARKRYQDLLESTYEDLSTRMRNSQIARAGYGATADQNRAESQAFRAKFDGFAQIARRHGLTIDLRRFADF